ncbi:hypothetical protein AMECASPLE_022364, partial [Ameca splendens]
FAFVLCSTRCRYVSLDFVLVLDYLVTLHLAFMDCDWTGEQKKAKDKHLQGLIISPTRQQLSLKRPGAARRATSSEAAGDPLLLRWVCLRNARREKTTLMDVMRCEIEKPNEGPGFKETLIERTVSAYMWKPVSATVMHLVLSTELSQDGAVMMLHTDRSHCDTAGRCNIH